MVLNEFY
jgi:DNA invertase Pin-like site-specific DNA recombinase